jgi:hypothetical protein
MSRVFGFFELKMFRVGAIASRMRRFCRDRPWPNLAEPPDPPGHMLNRFTWNIIFLNTAYHRWCAPDGAPWQAVQTPREWLQHTTIQSTRAVGRSGEKDKGTEASNSPSRRGAFCCVLAVIKIN